jgi:hypothetical protein
VLEGIDFTKVPRKAPACGECGSATRLSESRLVYDDADQPEFQNKPIWLCQCGAFAHCEEGTLMPRCLPSNEDTFQARTRVYDAWKAAGERIGQGLSAKKRNLKLNSLRWKLGREMGVKHYVNFRQMSRADCELAIEFFEGIK